MIDKKSAGTVDCEPTWESLLWNLVELADMGTFGEKSRVERKEEARRELLKMAKAADAYQALQKAGKVP